MQQRERLLREAQAVLLRDGERLGAGARVRAGRAGGDHVERIAQDVGEDDGEHLRRGAELREAAALDGGEPLADGVDLDDVRAAGEQLARDVLQLRAGDERLFKQRAAAAGEQEEHGILRREPLHEVERRLRAEEGVFVRHGMAGLVAVDALDGAHHMAVFGDDDAALDAAAEAVPGGFGHLPGGLARGDEPHAAARRDIPEGARHGLVRTDGAQRAFDDLVSILTKRFVHEAASLCSD